MSGDIDSIIIGAGHNGLVCAGLLARAGQRVLVLEASSSPGGGAGLREFAPGFRAPVLAHGAAALPRGLVAALDLARHGLRDAAGARGVAALRAGAPPVVLRAGVAQGVTAEDADAYAAFSARMARFAAQLRPLLEAAPPRLGTDSWADRLGLLRLAWQLRRLGRTEMRALLRIIGMNVHDLAEEIFTCPDLRGAVAWEAVLGANLGPRSPGTVLTLLHRMACAAESVPADMGNLGAVLAEAAGARGATIRLNAPVARVLVREDRACGVVLESGETIAAARVVSNADPRTSFLRLLGAEYLDTGFVRAVTHYRDRGLAAKLHLALRAAPSFTGLDAAAMRGRIVMAGGLAAIERAFNPSKYGEVPDAPAMECTVPSLADAALAPAGQHVLSAIVQFVPHTLKTGWDEAARAALTQTCLDVLEAHAPGLRGLVVAAELLTPADIARACRSAGGHWHHGELAFDQIFMVRPVPGATQYATPVAGFYLCGAGAHPGGGVNGLAGQAAARQILQEAR